MRATDDDLRDIAGANERFREEAARYGLVFRCDGCAHLHRASWSCSMGYPNHFLVGEHRAIEPSGALAFCKYFELGEDLAAEPG